MLLIIMGAHKNMCRWMLGVTIGQGGHTHMVLPSIPQSARLTESRERPVSPLPFVGRQNEVDTEYRYGSYDPPAEPESKRRSSRQIRSR